MLEKTARKGQLIVCAFIVLLLGSSLSVFANSLFANGKQYFIAQFIQVCISSLLAWSLYKGNDWARKVLGVLTISASVLGLIMAMNAINFTWQVVLIGIYSLTIGTAGILLVFSKKVKHFMEFQKGVSR